MCKKCVTHHLDAIVVHTRDQLASPECQQLELQLPVLEPCIPYHAQVADPKDRGLRHTIYFPGSSENEARSFAVFLRLCDMLLNNLKENRVVTSRDLYYKDVALFKSQKIVVRALDRIVRYFRVPRSELNVIASPNGLIAADLSIALETGEMLEIKRRNGASLIPVTPISYVRAPLDPSFILVVEKEAVFSHLHSELEEGIVVTGKGFPDRATRSMLKALAVTYPHLPMYGLVDSDPHGILILRNYQTGSAQTFEPLFDLNLEYLGVSLLEYSEGLVPLTLLDVNVATSTLRKEWIQEPKYAPYRQELQRGLFMGLKGEMNLLDKNQSQRLAHYVREKIGERVFCEDDGAKLARFVSEKPNIVYLESKMIEIVRNAVRDQYTRTRWRSSNDENHDSQSQQQVKKTKSKRSSSGRRPHTKMLKTRI